VTCCHYYEFTETGDRAFAVDVSAITFGPGALAELGDHARALGLGRVGLFTDPAVAALPHLATAVDSLRQARVEVAVYDEVRVEPTDQSFLAAARFAAEGRFDGFVSVGGGSVIDTCKAANLYSTYPADLMTYVNPPVGAGQPIPGALRPHIACPTTSGTGSECTGIAVFDLLEIRTKTGIASRRLRPTQAIIDPACALTLPAGVVAASGFDVLSHALESYTAVPYSQRARPERPSLRPMSQGANPWSDMGCERALTLVGRYFERAVADAGDVEARTQMMYAATLAGIAFGNCGVHVPHGMSYSVAGLVKNFQARDYPRDEPIIPHGLSVIVNAPSAFRFTGSACPERHLRGAELLGADIRGALPEDAGAVVGDHIIRLMQRVDAPNGLNGVGYDEADTPALSEGAFLQQRLLNNAPVRIELAHLYDLYRGAMSYW
jgi:alcohol dehydrogenase class IV